MVRKGWLDIMWIEDQTKINVPLIFQELHGYLTFFRSYPNKDYKKQMKEEWTWKDIFNGR